jgi:hypothetical protein
MHYINRILPLAWVMALIFSATAYAQSDVQVRFVHALPGAPNVDIALNGELVAQDVPYGQASDYIDAPTGDLNLTVTATGQSDALFEQTVTTGAEPVTLIVSSADGFTAYTDNIDPLNIGQARLTAVHAIDGGPDVDVVLTDGRPVIAGLAYDTPYGTLDVPVFNYSLNVIPAGEGLTNALFPEPFSAPLSTGTSYMAVVYGAVDAPEVLLLDTAVRPNPGSGFLQITHDIEDGPAVDVYANDRLVAPGLTSGLSTVAFPVPADTYNLQITEADTVNILGGNDVLVNEGTITAASIALDGETVVVSAELGEPDITTAVTDPQPTQAASSASEVVTAAPAPTSAEVVAAQSTQPPAQATPVSAGSTNPDALLTGRVNLDPGANLQLRQYPDSSALSLGLAPAGATLDILGREGPPAQIEGLFSQEVQDEIDAFVDPAEDLPREEDLSPVDTWLQVNYTPPDGGQIEAWVLSQFLDIPLPDTGPVRRLADLPLVPNNDAGQAAGTEVTPPPVPDDVVSAQVFNLNPGVNLQLRRTASRFGESLALLPNGTVLEYLGFEITDDEIPGEEAARNAEWVFVRYSPPEGGEITGWVSSQYVQLYWRGERIDIEEMVARTLLLFEDPTTRGELGTGATPPPAPTVDPLKDQAIATVVLDPGANLQFRRDPSTTAESLGLIPTGTQLFVNARDASGEWLQVEFEGQTGWVGSNFVRLTFNGELLDIDELLIEGE